MDIWEYIDSEWVLYYVQLRKKKYNSAYCHTITTLKGTGIHVIPKWLWCKYELL